jgi:hypothetical protein
MGYLYSQRNRLDEPHSYMYAPFEGMPFLDSYLSSRLEYLRSAAPHTDRAPTLERMLLSRSVVAITGNFDAASPQRGSAFRQLSGFDGSAAADDAQSPDFNQLAAGLTNMKAAESVVTCDLLSALVASQLVGANPADTKLWLDRLVQRFEVTKKLFDLYPPGFRKGQGSNTSVRLYWLFALALCLFHSGSSQIKYLSTLLKVCDLLCSLPGNMLESEIPRLGMSVILAAEINSVRRLAEMKELKIGSA